MAGTPPALAQGPDEWPMFGGGPAHGFSNTATPPGRLGLIWDFAGNATLGSAVVADDFVYIADTAASPQPPERDLVVLKMAAENGTRDWVARIRSPEGVPVGPSFSLAVDATRVYTLVTLFNATTNEYQEILIALRVSDGTVAWRFTGTTPWAGAATPTTSAPVLGGSLAIFGSQDGNVYAVTAGTGALSWWFPTGAPVNTVPAVFADIVYVTSGSTLFFLDLDGLTDGDQGPPEGAWTGDELLRVDAGAAITASPVVADPYVYLAVAGDLRAIDRTGGGSSVWSDDTTHESRGTPAVSGNLIVVRRSDGRVYGFHRSTGQAEWVRAGLMPPAGGADVAIADGRVFLSSVNGSSYDLVTLRAADGSVTDRNATSPRGALGSPVAAKEIVFVSEGTRLLAYRGQPDMAVFASDVAVEDAVLVNNVARARLAFTVRNDGDEPAAFVRVRVYDGAEDPANLIGDLTIGDPSRPISAGGRASEATPARDWTVGRHDITIVIDRLPTEANTDNNRITVPVFVMAGPSPPPQVVGAGPTVLALLVGLLIGLAVLYLPMRRVREVRKREEAK